MPTTKGGYEAWVFCGTGSSAAEMAASMVLLLAAGLVTRGLVQSLTIHPGFETSNISVVDLDLQEAGYDATRAAAFHRTLAERLAALPGVDATAQARTTPLSGSRMGQWLSPDRRRSPLARSS